MTEQFVDTIIVASIDKEWLKCLSKCWKLLLATLKTRNLYLHVLRAFNVIALIRFFRIRCTVT